MVAGLQNPTRKSNSSEFVSFWEKVKYNFGLFQMRLESSNGGASNGSTRVAEIGRLAAIFEAQTGRKAIQSQIAEIGFGARPERAFVMSGFFANTSAIDLDAPMLTLGDLVRILRRNGFERALKSFVRHALFDSEDGVIFTESSKKKLPSYDPDAVRFIIGDAAEEKDMV